MRTSLRLAEPASPLPDPSAEPLPYGRHGIDASDVEAVLAALHSGRLAHGPLVDRFEEAFADKAKAAQAVACSSGTAALHLAMTVQGLGAGNVCVVPAVTFLSTATAARFCGAEVAFADVDPITGLMTAETLDAAFDGAAGRAALAVPVHLGGRLCDTAGLAQVAAAHGAGLIEDACHALGGRDEAGFPVGACPNSSAAVFSFHPVKTVAAGEGGMVALNDAPRAERMRRLRNHGVTRDSGLLEDSLLSLDEDGEPNPWSYEQIELGFNYRMNELEAALGASQLRRLESFVRRRRYLSGLYDIRLAMTPGVHPIAAGRGAPGLHLYQVHIDFEAAGRSRAQVMRAMAEVGIHTQVHYIPLYRQPYFRRRYGSLVLSGAEAFYRSVLALPLFPAMADEDVGRVCDAVEQALG